MENKNKGGRPRKEPKETISFKVPAVIKEEVKQEARPIIDNIVKKKMKKLLPILLILLASCTKSDGLKLHHVKVLLSQGGESVVVHGYLEKPATETWVYLVETLECGEKKIREVRIEKGETYGRLHYQTNCKVDGWWIVYDDILRQ